MAGATFVTVPSNNHASPSGSLPFLLIQPNEERASSERTRGHTQLEVVPAKRLKKWAADYKTAGDLQEPGDTRYEAYASLLESRIRQAWVRYLTPPATYAYELY